MFAYETLARHSGAFRSLTGMTPDQFEALLADFRAALDRGRKAARTTRRGAPRRRAAGGGHPHRHDDRHRLLLTLVWLRVYPTYELLGLYFGLHKRNAQLNVRAVLAVLDTLDDFPFDRPDGDPARRRLSTPEQVMDAFPQVRLVVDGKEQRVQRPHARYEARKPFYSGKKKAFTVKCQIAVGPDGLIESVSDAVPGSVHDLTLLRRSKLLDRLGPGEGIMGDKAYVGITDNYPGVPVVLPAKAQRNWPLPESYQARNRVVNRYRIVVEHALAQLNRYRVLQQVFRGRYTRHELAHGQVVRVVARLVNRRTRVCPLKTYAKVA
jgi:hypothetical protein